MLAVAAEQARARGIANVDFREADAEHLPFPDQAFDGVSCRFGVMFFPEPDRALSEMRRVLRPGGRVALVAWGAAERHSLVQAIAPIGRYVSQPSPEPGAPHQFRFAAPGSLSTAMRAAGFREVEEETQTIAMPWPGPPERIWLALREIAPPLRQGYEALSPEQRAQLDGEVLAGLHAQHDGRQLRASAEVIVASGVR